MAFRFQNLDGTTRAFMAAEVDRDTSLGVLYLSPRLSERGRIDWPSLLRAAVEGGDETQLAEALRGTGRLVEFETRRKPRGRVRSQKARVPVSAPETLADGEFNRFYIRGVCLRALDEGKAEVEVYRAKEVVVPRPGSVDLLGRRVPVDRLLEDLRSHSGEEEPEMQVPGGPNSGLSVRLV